MNSDVSFNLGQAKNTIKLIMEIKSKKFEHGSFSRFCISLSQIMINRYILVPISMMHEAILAGVADEARNELLIDSQNLMKMNNAYIEIENGLERIKNHINDSRNELSTNPRPHEQFLLQSFVDMEQFEKEISDICSKIKELYSSRESEIIKKCEEYEKCIKEKFDKNEATPEELFLSWCLAVSLNG